MNTTRFVTTKTFLKHSFINTFILSKIIKEVSAAKKRNPSRSKNIKRGVWGGGIGEEWGAGGGARSDKRKWPGEVRRTHPAAADDSVLKHFPQLSSATRVSPRTPSSYVLVVKRETGRHQTFFENKSITVTDLAMYHVVDVRQWKIYVCLSFCNVYCACAHALVCVCACVCVCVCVCVSECVLCI
jgi:hypothetical protein